jgi:hypothetical protein
MDSAQTTAIAAGIFIALVYAGAIGTSGFCALRIVLGRRFVSRVDGCIGQAGFLWLAFVVGQGIVSVGWLALALTGRLDPWIVWVFVISASLAGGAVFLRQRPRLRIFRATQLRSIIQQRWHMLLGCSVLIVVVLSGTMAILPSGVDDALRWYLVLPRVVAESHRLQLHAFLSPYFGLHPIQIEMHWAALFGISNETAVTVWDALCAFSTLAGIGLLAAALTSSRRVAILAVLMILSTPGFYNLIGGGKPDNAAAQYAIAAFVWVALLPRLGLRSTIFAGCCAGWMIAGRYTNAVLLPGLVIFAILMLRASESSHVAALVRSRKFWAMHAVAGSIAAGLAGAPMLIKNWLLGGCPVALIFSCQEKFLTGPNWIKGALSITTQKRFSLTDVLSYPLVWTYGSQGNLLGNISPLFIGCLPFFFLYRRSMLVRSGAAAGIAGASAIVAWWLFINGLFPNPRWIVAPLGLVAIALSASLVAANDDFGTGLLARRLAQGAIATLLVFLLFQSRGAIYAIRYAAGIDNRSTNYNAKPGYDVATWLNGHLHPGQRVAFAGWNGFSYFLDPTHLLNTETLSDAARLWQLCRCSAPDAWTSSFWNFYADRGFTYVLVGREAVPKALSVSPASLRLQIAFVGRNDAVLKIEPQEKVQRFAEQKDAGVNPAADAHPF